MALTPGARLGAYEINAAIGAGGMGEVYRARDVRLDRTVAIKVLPAALAAEPQLRERFDREARAISSLNHPHICTLYDVGHQDGIDFLVLEYLEGETLEARVRRNDGQPLPSADALRIAIDVADALAVAHRAGVIHRDLKPGNIFLVRSGGASAPPMAKLLDFGLAKTPAPVVNTGGLSMAPTTPPNLTAQGTILGTFQYMAPEQIEGLDADARTDIFAFGAVLFEMLTGRPAFEGKTRASLLGAILREEPPPVSQIATAGLGASGSVVSPALDRIVSTCLAKDPEERWQSARDLVRELKWVAQRPVETALTEKGRTDEGVRRWRPALTGPLVAVLATAFAAAGTIAVRHLREAPPAQESIQFTIGAPENTQFGGPAGGGSGVATQVALSPDGRQVVFVAKTQEVWALWLRPMATMTARQLTGTDGATFPFWSPDSRYIGFFANGKLKRVQASGGPPITLCDAPAGRGGTWNRENVIVFAASTQGALQRVSGAGGTPTDAAVLDASYGETSHRWPYFLPDGRHYLFTGTIGTCCPASKPARIRVGALDTKTADTLITAESASVFAAGHVLFVRDGTLMAQPFDPASRRLAADAFPIAEGVGTEGSRYGTFSTSDTGALVYGHGAAGGLSQLVWLDRSGKRIGTLGEPGRYTNLALSPDEQRVAVSQDGDVWIIDVARGVSSRLTFDPASEDNPVWSPDSARVAFRSSRNGERGLRVKSANGAGTDEALLASDSAAPELVLPVPDDWSADGRFLVYTILSTNPSYRSDLWIVPVSDSRSAGSQRSDTAGGPKPFAFAQGPGAQNRAAISPDSRWIAYDSDESGNPQVYVQPFPPTGGRYQVSKAGGQQPHWRGDGKELLFLASDGTLMAAPIDTTRDFRAGIPVALFNSGAAPNARRQYAVTRDGQRFLVHVPDRGLTAAHPLTVLVNWLAAVQR